MSTNHTYVAHEKVTEGTIRTPASMEHQMMASRVAHMHLPGTGPGGRMGYWSPSAASCSVRTESEKEGETVKHTVSGMDAHASAPLQLSTRAAAPASSKHKRGGLEGTGVGHAQCIKVSEAAAKHSRRLPSSWNELAWGGHVTCCRSDRKWQTVKA